MPDTHDGTDRASTWLHPEQVGRMRTACYDDRFAPRFRRRNDAILTLLYDTGLRAGELVRLDVDHLDLDAATVRVPRRRRDAADADRSSRETIPLDSTHSLGTVRLLTSYLGDRDAETAAVAVSREGGRLTPKGVRDVVSKAAEVSGVRPYTPFGRGTPGDVSPQTVRHSTAWRLLTVEDRSIADVQRRLGHTARSTTRSLYSHFESVDDDTGSDDSRPSLGDADLSAPFQSVLDTLPDVLFVFDTDGRMRWWNDRLPAATGYADEDIASMHPLEFVPDDDARRISEAISRVVERESVETRESHLVTSSGNHVPYEFVGAPLTDGDGAVWAIVGAGRDITARTRARRDAERERRLFDVFVDAVVDYAMFVLDPRGVIVSWNRGAERIKGYTESEILGRHFSVLYPDDAVEAGHPERLLEEAVASGHVQEEGWRVRKDGSTFWAHVTITPLYEGDTLRGFAKVTRDMTERRERNREIQRQRDELERVNRLNTIIRDVDQALVAASSRDDIEQAVCDRLASVDPYVGAWVGGSRSTNAPATPRVSAGLDDDTLDRIEAGLTGDEAASWPSRRACRTRDVHVGRDFAAGCESARDPLESLDASGAIAIPIRHRETLYGVLVVYTAAETPVGDRQRRVLGELGETIGHAIVGTERKAALAADSVVELTLGVRDPGQFFVQLARRHGASVALEGVARRGADSYLEYHSVDGAEPAAILDLADELDTVDRARVVAHRDQRCLCEVAVNGESIPNTVAEFGGTLTEMTADDGFEPGTVRVELPQSGDVTHVVDALDRRFHTVELNRKRTVDRPIRTEQRFSSAVHDRLTDKQRQALEAAYYAGFFDHPRLSTGEDVASSLGVSPSTFHQHVRVGLHKLLTALVEAPADEDD